MPTGFRPFVSPSGATSPVTGQTADISGSTQDLFVAVFVTGTASVILEGSLTNLDAEFIPLATITATTIYHLTKGLPYYRVRVASISSGIVTAQYGLIVGRDGQMGNVAAPLAKAGGPQ